MKKLVLLSFGALYLFSCNKNEPGKVADNNANMQTVAFNLELYTAKLKFNRDFIINNKGKYDCSTSGKNCSAGKSATSLQLDQLSILDNYMVSGTTSTYFAENDYSIIFPELLDAGAEAIGNREIFMHKKEGEDGARTYVLSTTASPDNTTQNNTIAVWQL